jgi:flagellin-specific chaperone FliS
MTSETRCCRLARHASLIYCAHGLRLRLSEQRRSELTDSLRGLYLSAEPYAADQSNQSYAQIQPVTVAEAEKLNAALRVAWALIDRSDRNG